VKVYYFIVGVAGIGVSIWASVHYPHMSWFPLSMAGFVSGSLVSASGLLSRKRRPEIPRVIHRQCHWCGFTAYPTEVLMHEIQEHQA